MRSQLCARFEPSEVHTSQKSHQGGAIDETSCHCDQAQRVEGSGLCSQAAAKRTDVERALWIKRVWGDRTVPKLLFLELGVL